MRVELAGRDITATATYTVPASADRVPPDALSGLYVSVQAGSRPLRAAAGRGVGPGGRGRAPRNRLAGLRGGSADVLGVDRRRAHRHARAGAAAPGLASRATARPIVAELARAPYGVTPEVFAALPRLWRAGDGEIVTFCAGAERGAHHVAPAPGTPRPSPDRRPAHAAGRPRSGQGSEPARSARWSARRASRSSRRRVTRPRPDRSSRARRSPSFRPDERSSSVLAGEDAAGLAALTRAGRRSGLADDGFASWRRTRPPLRSGR